MKTTISRFVLPLMLLAAACGPSPDQETEATDALAFDPRPGPLGLAFLRTKSNPCPASVDTHTNGIWHLREHLRRPLDRFCTYTFEQTGPGEPDIVGLDDHPDLESSARADFGEVFTLTVGHAGTSSLIDQLAGTLWDAYRRELGLPAEPPKVSATPNARLSIVDTMPEGAVEPNSVHAPALADLAEGILCDPGGDCAAVISHDLALPRVSNKIPDPINGGNYGTILDLARGIVAGTREGTPENVVMNLSVGWESKNPIALPATHWDLVTGSYPTVTSTVRVVHTALTFARCENALIIAASGNDPLGIRDMAGAMYPAAWADLQAPSAADCVAMFGGQPAPTTSPPPEPFMYAASGLDPTNAPVANRRDRSMTQLAAPATGVVGPGREEILTGTSVAALGVSAIAASAWAIWPELSAHQIMTGIGATGTPLPIAADVCYGPSCWVTKVSACGTLSLACAAAPGRCRSTPTCPARGWVPDAEFDDAIVAIRGWGAEELDLRSQYGDEAQSGSCKNIHWLPTARQVCPTDETAALRDLDVGPQPVDPVCPACFASSANRSINLAVVVASQVPGGQVHQPIVTFYDGAQKEERFQLPSSLSQGLQQLLTLGVPTTIGTPVYGILQYEYEVNGNRFSGSEPLLIGPMR